MKYDAFISYRHTPLDMETAKKVHSGLETYHIPKPVQKKTGKKKIERVFRDQEELPIGSDLNDNISSALENSEYLLVICSPDTPGSYWVSKEIDTFISLHGREKILAVLVSGEPKDSFPPQLLTDDQGNPVEPLAADVRGATPKERKQRFKTEILRLAAPIIGCSYDDLKQRHRERILKRNIAIASVCAGVIAVAGTAFGIYNANVADRMQKLADEKTVLADEKTHLAEEKSQLADEMSQLADQMSKLASEKSQLADEKTQLADEKSRLAEQILEEYTEKQVNQSKFYAEKALSVLQTGKREDAALIALAGLPADEDRPYVPEAELALSKILYAYDDGSELSYDRTLNHNLPVDNIYQSEDGKYLITVDNAYTVYVWNTADWELQAEIPSFIDEVTNLNATVKSIYTDSETLYITTPKSFSAYDLKGNHIYTAEFPGSYGSIVSPKLGKAFLIDVQKITVLNLSDGSFEIEIINEYDTYYSENSVINADNSKIAIAHYEYSTGDTPGRVSVIDTENYSVSSFETVHCYVSALLFAKSGTVAAVSTNDVFALNDFDFAIDVATDSGEIVWSGDVPVKLSDLVYKVLLKTNTVNNREIFVLAIHADTFTFDAQTGELISQISLPSSSRSLDLIKDSSTAYVSYNNGDIDKLNIINGTVYPYASRSTNLFISKMLVIDNGVAISSLTSDIVWILQYHTASDMISLPDPVEPSFAVGCSPSGFYAMREDSDYHAFHFYDTEHNHIFSFKNEETLLNEYCFSDNSFIICGYHDLWIINPIEGTIKDINFEEAGIDRFQTITNVSFSTNKKYAAIYNMFYVAVIDIENGTLIFKSDEEKRLGTCAISSDGNTLLLSRAGEIIDIIDVPTGAVTKAQDKNLIGLYRCLIDISPDGKYAAFTCQDSHIRLINLPEGTVCGTIYLPTQNRAFISFSADSSHLFIQGDNLEVQIWKIRSGDSTDTSPEYIGSIEGMQLISSVTEDPDGFIAFGDNEATTLIETGKYGTVAFAEHATLYLPEDNSFIISRNGKLYKTYYKDYKQLIEEVHKQFPDAVLTDEMKTRYNIE